jgi:cytochrome c553
MRLAAPIALAISGLLGSACVGVIDGVGASDDGISDEEAAALEAFDNDVVPVLQAACAACHASMANIDFLKSDPDVRTRLLEWPNKLVDLDAPAASRLLTKGAHEGPALTPEQGAPLLSWIQLERTAAGVDDVVVELTPFQPVDGMNDIDLAAIGLTGSAITFRMERLSVGMYLSEMQVTAGPDGVTLTHPLFVHWVDGSPSPDPIDRFADIDLSLGGGNTAMIGGGTAVFVDVDPDAMMSVHFRAALAEGEGEGGEGGGGGGGGGCKDVASFTANAQPGLSASCVSCHGGGNPGATSAVDMRKVNDTSPEGQASACGQILSRVLLADPVNSGLFVAPDPASGTLHDFKFASAGAFTGFRDQVIQWINQENAL